MVSAQRGGTRERERERGEKRRRKEGGARAAREKQQGWKQDEKSFPVEDDDLANDFKYENLLDLSKLLSFDPFDCQRDIWDPTFVLVAGALQILTV